MGLKRPGPTLLSIRDQMRVECSLGGKGDPYSRPGIRQVE